MKDEFQQRTALHFHGLLWCLGGPDFIKLKNKLSELGFKDVTIEKYDDYDQDIQIQMEEIIQYIDEHITAINTLDETKNFSNRLFNLQNKHNSLRKKFTEVTDYDEDYLNIILRTNRHTECTDKTCWRYKKDKNGKITR